MRPLLVILIWVVLLGGLGAYQAARRSLDEQREDTFRVQRAPGIYAVEITPTFYAQGGVNDFALELVAQSSIILSLNSKEIARHEETAQAAIPLTFTWDIEAVPMELEKNEFRVTVNTPAEDANAVHGARFRLLRDGAEVFDQTIWSEPGAPLDGVVRVTLDEPSETGDDHVHGD